MKLRAPRGSSCIRPRFPAGGSARRRTGSSTGSPPRASRGGRCCRSDRRTSSARRIGRRPRSRPGRGWSPRPTPRSPRRSSRTFVARHPYWIGEWARFAGPGAIADQVRFEREWGALRAYGRERGVRLIGDVPIYVLRRRRRRRGLAGAVRARRGRRARRRTRSSATASTGATRCTTGRRTGRPATAGGSSAFARVVRARRPHADRPLPRVRLVLGDSGRGTRRRAAGAGAAAPASSSSARSSTRSATCP